jgi:hypothetical protein
MRLAALRLAALTLAALRLAALTRMHAPSHATDTQIVHHNRHQQILRLLHPVAILEAKET